MEFTTTIASPSETLFLIGPREGWKTKLRALGHLDGISIEKNFITLRRQVSANYAAHEKIFAKTFASVLHAKAIEMNNPEWPESWFTGVLLLRSQARVALRASVFESCHIAADGTELTPAITDWVKLEFSYVYTIAPEDLDTSDF